MRQEQSMCPVLTVIGGVTEGDDGTRTINKVECCPQACMWAVRTDWGAYRCGAVREKHGCNQVEVEQ